MKHPTPNYDYSRAGVLAVTLKCHRGVWLCRITQDTYTLLPIGRYVREGLLRIPGYYPQIKIGAYQIMPDHVHVMVHVVEDLPKGITVRRVFRGFKIGVKRSCEEGLTGFHGAVFEDGLYDRPVLDEELLESEIDYIHDNVRRYRLKKANAGWFRTLQLISKEYLSRFGRLWGLGNRALLDAPHLVYLQFSRSLEEGRWPEIEAGLKDGIRDGAVFVSPFISPFERRALETVIGLGGRVIRITTEYFDERYKPHGGLIDAFCEGRVLEIGVATEFGRAGKLDRATCMRLQEVARGVAFKR